MQTDRIEDLKRLLETGDIDAARELYRLGERHGDRALSTRALEVLRLHRSREQPIRLLELEALRLGRDRAHAGARQGVQTVSTRLALDAAGEVLVAVRSDGSAGLCHALDGGDAVELGELGVRCEGILTHPLAPFVMIWGRDDGALHYRGIDVRSGRLLPRHSVPGGRHVALGTVGVAYVVVECRGRTRRHLEVPSGSSEQGAVARLGGRLQARLRPHSCAAEQEAWTHEIWEAPNVLTPPRRLPRGAHLVGAWRGAHVSPWGRWLYEPDARSDRNLRLWSTLERVTVTLPTAGYFIDLVAVVHDDTRALVVDHRGTRSRLRLFELPGATLVEQVEFEGILRPACLGSGDHLLGLSLGRVHVWSTHDLRQPARIVPAPGRTLGLHHELACDPSAHVVAIADGHTLQTTDLDRLPSPLDLGYHEHRLSTALLADAAGCVMVEDGHRVSLVDIEAAARGRLVRCTLANDTARKRACAITPDARRVMWCQTDPQGPRLALLELDGCGAPAGEVVANGAALSAPPRMMPLLRPVAASALHPGGGCIAIATHPADSEVELFTWETLQRVGHFEVTNRVYCLSFSPDGRWLALAAGSGEVQLWDLRQGAQRLGSGRAPMRGMYDVVQAIGFDAEGAMFATLRGTVHRIDRDGRFHAAWIEQPEEEARAIVFSPGGRYLAQRLRSNRIRIVDLTHERASAAEIIVGMPDALLLTGAGKLLELELGERRLVVHALPDLEDPLPPPTRVDFVPLEPEASWSRIEEHPIPSGLEGDAALIYRELESSLRGEDAERLALDPRERTRYQHELLPRAARMLDAMQSLVRVASAADLKEAMRCIDQHDGQHDDASPAGFPGPQRELVAELLYTEPLCALQRRLQPSDLTYSSRELLVLGALTGHEVFTGRGRVMLDELTRQVAFERAVLELRASLPIGFGVLQLEHTLRGGSAPCHLGALVIVSTCAMRRPDPTPMLRLITDAHAPLEQRAAAVSCMAGLGFEARTLSQVEALARANDALWPRAVSLWDETRRQARLAGLLPL